MAYDQKYSDANRTVVVDGGYHPSQTGGIQAGHTLSGLKLGKDGAFDASIAEAVAETDSLVERLSLLVDRLCGSEPANQSSTSGDTAGGGVFGAVESANRRIARRARYGHALLERIDRVLS